MLQNAAIDVAISLALMYSMLSVFCTLINEFIATKLRLRAKSLESALGQLLDNQELRDTFYRHGLIVGNKRAATTGAQSTMRGIAGAMNKLTPHIRTLVATVVKGTSKVVTGTAPPSADGGHPSYLSGRDVALALIGSLDRTKPVPTITDIQDAVQSLPASNIRDTLESSLTEAGNDLDRLRTSIATSFDNAMERLSGAYKRKLKWISMLVGLGVTVGFNADSVHVATTLWGDQASRASVIAVATEMSRGRAPGSPGDIDETKLKAAAEATRQTIGPLPIGWHCRASGETHDLRSDIASYWGCVKSTVVEDPVVVIGWIVTAAALSLGAPFWFDLLQKFVNIRGAGEKPEREDAKATS
jgi:hypothetical protein